MESTARYEARKALGAGGMGEVFLAHDRELDRLVALKLVNEDVSKDILVRFDRECDVLGRLTHPAIVPILDRGKLPSGRYFYTMPFIEDSKNMTSWLRGHLKTEQPPVPATVVLQLLSDVASALDYIHAQGVFHRDIKPSNILVVPPGKGVLIDFGLAGLVNSELTKTGTIVGTMGYLSPEQAAGADPTGLSDLYQLGLVLYHLATGVRASTDAFSYVSDMAQGKSPFPPPAEREPRVGPALEAIIVKATQLRPQDRFRTGKEMMDAIAAAGDGWLKGAAPKVEPAKPRPTGKTPRVTASAPASSPASSAASSGASSLASSPTSSGRGRVLAGAAAALVAAVAAFALLRGGAAKLIAPPEVVLGFSRAEVRFATDRAATARVRWSAAGQPPQAAADPAPATDHRIALAPLAAQAAHTYDVLVDGETPAASGTIVGPSAPQLKNLTAQMTRGGLTVAVMLTAPATGTLTVSAGGEVKQKPLGAAAVSHRVTFDGFATSGPVDVSLVLTSALGEAVEVPARSITPSP